MLEGQIGGYQDDFDECIQCGRLKIKNTFEILKKRWTILKAVNCVVEHAGTITVACCVLHNFCKLHNDRRQGNPVINNTSDITNGNDVQLPIQTRQLSEAVLQCAGTLNRNALF